MMPEGQPTVEAGGWARGGGASVSAAGAASALLSDCSEPRAAARSSSEQPVSNITAPRDEDEALERCSIEGANCTWRAQPRAHCQVCLADGD